jgi:hypothetical protein
MRAYVLASYCTYHTLSGYLCEHFSIQAFLISAGPEEPAPGQTPKGTDERKHVIPSTNQNPTFRHLKPQSINLNHSSGQTRKFNFLGFAAQQQFLCQLEIQERQEAKQNNRSHYIFQILTSSIN